MEPGSIRFDIRAGFRYNNPMKTRLGVNCGFAINRYVEPEAWLDVVAGLGLRTVQFVADLLNPFLPEEVLEAQVATIRRLADERGIAIESTFTSAFTRVNHLAHPDPAQQRVWVAWFKRWFAVSRRLGAKGSGSHFGILTFSDFNDPQRREQRTADCVRHWQELSQEAARLGLKYLMFEPMSIPREYAETIPAARALLDRVNEDMAVPMKLCLDVDHGDLQSKDPRDTDPYAWLEAFAAEAPVIHLKQSLADKSGHRPFTPENNARGRIHPGPVLAALEAGGAEDVQLLFEFSWRERWPTDYRVVEDLRASVEYWRPYVPD